MRFEKLFTPSVMHKIGVGAYGRNEADNEEKTPHYLMKKALEVYEETPLVNSGVNQIVSFTTGNTLIAESEDENSAKFLKEWKDMRPQLVDELNFLTTLYFICGTAYLEPSYTFVNDKLCIDNIFTFFDPSRVFYNFFEKDSKEEYWLIEMDPNIREIEFQGTIIHPRFRQWKTSPYSWFFKSNIWAAGINKNSLFQIRQPYTRDGYYGFSFLQSVINDAEAIHKIVRNLVAISNNKSIGRKLISVGSEIDIVNEDDIEIISEKLNDSDYNNVVVNKKIQLEDLSYTGTYDTMIAEMEFLRKDISSGLVPNFITSWTDEQNKASAEQARIPFIHTIEFHRTRLENFINRVITQNLIEVYNLHPSSKFKFKEVNFYSINEKKDVYLELYLQNIITYNEMRKFMELEPVEDGDIYFDEFKQKITPIEDIGMGATTELPEEPGEPTQ